MPHAVLLHGPIYGGKLTVALELARILTCLDGRGEWSCGCAACEQQRLLIHPGLQLMGPRYFREEILASAEVLGRTRCRAARYLYIRAVRKLLKRFDRVLCEDEESRVKQVFALVAETEEDLERFSPDRSLPEPEALRGLVEDMAERTNKIAAAVQQDNIPIDHVRRVTSWAHLSSRAARKIIVMENVDRMLESSRNSLLKILEEPPENVYFILTTTRRSLVIQTVLSRLRPYALIERTGEEQRRVLRQVFREEESDFGTLREFFLAWRNVNPHGLKGLARNFLRMVESRKGDHWMPMDDMAEAMKGGSGGERCSPEALLRAFGEELLLLLGSRLREANTGDLRRLERWSELIAENVSSMASHNLQPRLVLENLYLRMRENA